jgi:hypothetical protein
MTDEKKEATLEELAKEVPEVCRRVTGNTGGANLKLNKLKKLNVLEWLIMVGKMKGMTDIDLARQIGTTSTTIGKYRKKIAKSEWYESVAQDILSLSPLFVESLRVNALKADPYTTVHYFEGLGHFTKKHEIDQKVTVDDQRTRFAKQVEGILGIDITKEIPVDTPYSELPKEKEQPVLANDDLAIKE